MLLIALSVPCVAFNKAVFSGLITHLDLCYILIFGGRVEFPGGSPMWDLSLTLRKEAERRERICLTSDTGTLPAQVWLLNREWTMEAMCLAYLLMDSIFFKVLYMQSSWT